MTLVLTIMVTSCGSYIIIENKDYQGEIKLEERLYKSELRVHDNKKKSIASSDKSWSIFGYLIHTKHNVGQRLREKSPEQKDIKDLRIITKTSFFDGFFFLTPFLSPRTIVYSANEN